MEDKEIRAGTGEKGFTARAAANEKLAGETEGKDRAQN